jgi:tRNA pseudouridine55 synthase
MNGVLVIDKPAGITSHDVVWRVRKILRQKSVGHTGTLDPFATGVLVVLLGKATRLAQFLDKAEKEYLAKIRFGFETDTGDPTGTQTVESEARSFSKAEIESALAKFRGEILQTPPMYSAKKVGGKKLYELARKGEEIERQPVKIKISELELLETKDKTQTVNDELQIRVVCAAGTYIRVLAEDIGRALGSAAHLSELRRIRAGNFDLSKAVTLEDLENLLLENEIEKALISPNQALSHLPMQILSKHEVERTQNGMKIEAKDNDLRAAQFVRLCDEQANLVAIALFDENTQTLQPRVVLRTGDEN